MQKIDWRNFFDLFTGAVQPNVRMSQNLLDFYSTTSAFRIRSRCSSGITLALETDSETLMIEFSFGETAREIYSFDVAVNGVISSYDGRAAQKIALGDGVKQLVIYLPHLVVVKDFTMQIDDGAFCNTLPHRQGKLILCGDSIMQGMTASTPSRTLGALTADKLDLELFNVSVGGARMNAAVVAEAVRYGGKNDRIVVGFGINDVAHAAPADDFCSETQKVLALLDGFPGKAFVVAPIPAFFQGAEKRPVYSRIISECVEKHPEITLLDGSQFFPGREELFVDGIHPNDQGMQIYADALVNAIYSDN